MLDETESLFNDAIHVSVVGAEEDDGTNLNRSIASATLE